MRWLNRDVLTAFAYAANQGLAVLTTILLIRYGQRAFGLTWILGAMLALGWGTTLYGIVGPTLPAKLWHAPRVAGSKECIRALIVAICIVSALSLWPLSAQFLIDMTGMSKPWQMWFVSVGLLRAFAQVMSTYSVRHGKHARILFFQLTGRLVEIGLVLLAGIYGSWILVAVAWLAYPFMQILLLATEWREYRDGVGLEKDEIRPFHTILVTQFSQALDLVMPSIWMRGGAETFVAYRAVTSALANSTMLPRYWYVLSVDKPKGESASRLLQAAVLVTSLGFSALFQMGSNAVPWSVFGWSLIPLMANGMVMPSFSRLRQLCLNHGWLIPPAMAMIVGRLSELAILLAVLESGLINDAVIIAYGGFAMCLPALRYFYRRTS